MEVCCRNCGGSLVFIPGKDKCYCNYCRQESSISDIRINNNCKSNRNVCSDCGAELLTEKNTIITKCAYCGSHQINTSLYDGIFKPDLIIPFRYDIDSFSEKLRESAEHKELTPYDFIEKIEIQDIKGIYIPFRRSELFVKNDIRGEIVCELEDEKFEYHKPTYFECDCEYDGTIIYEVSKKVKNLDANSIGPFELDEAIEFNPAFLCNFSVQIGDDNIAKIISDEVASETERVLKKRMPNFTYNAGTIDINYTVKSDENILVPVWYFDYNYKGERYSCIMNGQTGKVIGKMPISKSKILRKAKDLVPFTPIVGALCAYRLTFNPLASLATFAALEVATHMESKTVEEKIVPQESNYSTRNLNSKVVVKKYVYNYIKSYNEYHEKYKNDKLEQQIINISDGKNENYHQKKDKVYDIKRNINGI